MLVIAKCIFCANQIQKCNYAGLILLMEIFNNIKSLEEGIVMEQTPSHNH